jgi:hypothetical protein
MGPSSNGPVRAPCLSSPPIRSGWAEGSAWRLLMPRFSLTAAALGAALLATAPARAEDPTLADLARLVAEQRRLIDEQGKELQVMRAELAETRTLAVATHDRVQGLVPSPQPSRPRARGLRYDGHALGPRATAGPPGAVRPAHPRDPERRRVRGRLPRLLPHPRHRRRPQHPRARAHDDGEHVRAPGHGGSIRHVLDPGGGHAGSGQAVAHRLHGQPEPAQLRHADADGCGRHPRLHRRRLRRLRPRAAPAPRLRPVGSWIGGRPGPPSPTRKRSPTESTSRD